MSKTQLVFSLGSFALSWVIMLFGMIGDSVPVAIVGAASLIAAELNWMFMWWKDKEDPR